MSVSIVDEHSEQALINRLRQRDPDAFAILFEAYSDRVFRLAVGLLDDEAEAEGIVQEAFLRLFQHLDRFEGRSRLSTWLYRVAYNLCMDRLRKRRPTLSLSVGSDDEEIPAPGVLADWGQWPERLLTDAEVNAALSEAIAALSEKYRAIFILREIEGLSTEETSQVAGISKSAAKVRLHRARLFLRERLAEFLLEQI